MGRLHVAAFAYPGSKQMEAGVVLVVSVSKADGSPVTGLTATNFRVQVLYDLYAASDSTAVDATSFEELAKPGGPLPNSLPGTYRLIFGGANGLQPTAAWTLIIQVHSGKGVWYSPVNQGWTVLGFDLRQQPQP
jgi:hypothetical protein